MPNELQDKVCFIAGASGAIGSAVAELFLREGARLALGTHTRTPLASLAASGVNDRTLAVPFDVRNWREVSAAIAIAREHFGALDILVNCAAVQGPIGPAQTLPIDAWARTIEINLLGAFYLVRAAAPLMIARRGGKIVHFSGGGAAFARPFFSAYAASKAAIVRLTETLAEELRDSNIQINTIAPGPVSSRMWDEMRAAGAAAGPKTLRELAEMDSTGGVPPARAAALALFLASSRSNGLTGRLISVVHDRLEDLPGKTSEIMKTEGGTLRRVPLG